MQEGVRKNQNKISQDSNKNYNFQTICGQKCFIKQDSKYRNCPKKIK